MTISSTIFDVRSSSVSRSLPLINESHLHFLRFFELPVTGLSTKQRKPQGYLSPFIWISICKYVSDRVHSTIYLFCYSLFGLVYCMILDLTFIPYQLHIYRSRGCVLQQFSPETLLLHYFKLFFIFTFKNLTHLGISYLIYLYSEVPLEVRLIMFYNTLKDVLIAVKQRCLRNVSS